MIGWNTRPITPFQSRPDGAVWESEKEAPASSMSVFIKPSSLDSPSQQLLSSNQPRRRPFGATGLMGLCTALHIDCCKS